MNTGRSTTKTGLLTATSVNYEKSNTLVSGLTEKELLTSFDFSHNEKKKKSDKQQLLIHLQ